MISSLWITFVRDCLQIFSLILSDFKPRFWGVNLTCLKSLNVRCAFGIYKKIWNENGKKIWSFSEHIFPYSERLKWFSVIILISPYLIQKLEIAESRTTFSKLFHLVRNTQFQISIPGNLTSKEELIINNSRIIYPFIVCRF